MIPVVNGSTIQWNKHKLFDNLTDEEISKITLEEYEQHEAKGVEKNAWFVAEEVQNLIYGAPVQRENISAFLTRPQKKQSFFYQYNIK